MFVRQAFRTKSRRHGPALGWWASLIAAASGMPKASTAFTNSSRSSRRTNGKIFSRCDLTPLGVPLLAASGRGLCYGIFSCQNLAHLFLQRNRRCRALPNRWVRVHGDSIKGFERGMDCVKAKRAIDLELFLAE